MSVVHVFQLKKMRSAKGEQQLTRIWEQFMRQSYKTAPASMSAHVNSWLNGRREEHVLPYRRIQYRNDKNDTSVNLLVLITAL